MEKKDYWEFLNHVTREMRMPLNEISSCVYELKEDEYRPSFAEDERVELLCRLDVSVHKMLRMVNMLANVSYYSSVKRVEQQDHVLVNQFCRELVGEQDVDVFYKSNVSDEYTLTTNAECLRLLLSILLEQASMRVLFRMDESKESRIFFNVLGGVEEGKVFFSVSDTGDRPSQEENMTAFFLPTIQRDRPFMMQADLHICAQIVSLLGGVIYIDPNYHDGRRVIFEIVRP